MRYNVMKAYRRLCELYGWPFAYYFCKSFKKELDIETTNIA